MKCYVDAGNSRIKWRVGPKGVVHVLDWAQAEDWGARLKDTVAAEGVELKRVIVAAVAPSERCSLIKSQLAATLPDVPVQWLKSRARCCGVRLGYPDPGQFGVDRFCALVAARARHPDQAVLVINAGTAVTMDYMNASGEHAGGMIMPSVHAMEVGLTALAPNLGPFFSGDGVSGTGAEGAKRKAPRTAKTESTEEVGYLAVDTHAALVLGARWMMAAAVNQMAAALMEDASTPEFRILIGGGGGGDLQSMLGMPATHVPDLVLEGIVLAARQQR